MMRIVLADDHHLVRAGLRSLLDTLENVAVVAEASDGEEAVRQVTALEADVALIDISMPKLSGLEALHRIKAGGRATQVLLLSMYDDDEYVAEAVRAGAAGYLVKDAAVEELELALNALRRGEMYLSPAISSKLARAFSGERPGHGLTRRQTDVLRLVAQGNSSKAIARLLSLSIKTVDTHRSQIMERLDIHDLAGLVRYAVRMRLVTSDH